MSVLDGEKTSLVIVECDREVLVSHRHRSRRVRSSPKRLSFSVDNLAQNPVACWISGMPRFYRASHFISYPASLDSYRRTRSHVRIIA